MQIGNSIQRNTPPRPLRSTRKNTTLPATPNVNQLMHNAFSKQKELLSSMPSSSSNFHLVALDVLEERGFQSAPTSTLRVPLTGKGLGGGIAELVKEIERLDESISTKEKQAEDIAERLDLVDPDGSDARAYNRIQTKIANELKGLRAKKAVANAKLKNLTSGAGSSRG